MMASPAGRTPTYPLHPPKLFTLLFIFFLSVLPPLSDGSSVLLNTSNKGLVESKIGSTPPVCVNKCMNCTPCMATLVIPPNINSQKKSVKRFKVSSPNDDDDDDDTPYYLLHWKCTCENKLYQP